MNVLDLIAREHVRLGGDLQRYTDEADSQKALELARSVLARLCAYLVAEQRCLLPPLLGVAAASSVLRVHHQHLKNSVAEAGLRSYRHDTAMVRAMLALQHQMEVYARREDIELGTLLRKGFSEGELQLIGGEMLMELAASRRPDPSFRSEPGFIDLLGALWARSRARRTPRRLARKRLLPVLRHAVSPYMLHDR